MPSFTGADYDHLFELGRKLYINNFNRSLVREIATELMAMCESVRGQQADWPNISKRYRHLITYNGAKPKSVIPFPKRTRSRY